MMKKEHFYAYSFMGCHRETGEPNCFASCYMGYEDQRINKPRINQAKAYALVNDGATLVSVSYLGHMTRQEFEGLEVVNAG